MDRVVWITGASSGIGRELARSFSRKGARLVLSARRLDALEETRTLCEHPDRVDLVALDLGELESLHEVAADVLGRHKFIDLMVHNAGVAHRDFAVATPLSVDEYIMAVNYFGPVSLTKALLPSMLARGSGRFVVVSSLSGIYGVPKASAYAASKHALHGFFESLRAEVHADGVRVTIVVPGFIKTGITRRALTAAGAPSQRSLSVHEKGMSARVCADRIVRVVEQGREFAVVGKGEVATVYLDRFIPRVWARVMRSHPVQTRDRWLSRLPWKSEPTDP